LGNTGLDKYKSLKPTSIIKVISKIYGSFSQGKKKEPNNKNQLHIYTQFKKMIDFYDSCKCKKTALVINESNGLHHDHCQ